MLDLDSNFREEALELVEYGVIRDCRQTGLNHCPEFFQNSFAAKGAATPTVLVVLGHFNLRVLFQKHVSGDDNEHEGEEDSNEGIICQDEDGNSCTNGYEYFGSQIRACLESMLSVVSRSLLWDSLPCFGVNVQKLY